MRVLTGQSKGKRLKVPRGKSLRPTAARIKKSMFDMLGSEVFGTKRARPVLRLGKSGNRSSQSWCFSPAYSLRKTPTTAGIIAQNLRSCGYVERSRILNFDFRKALSMLSAENCGFDIVFIDPPYEFYEKTDPHSLAREIRSVVGEEGVMVIEHPSGNGMKSEGFNVRTRKYGGTSVSFLRRLD